MTQPAPADIDLDTLRTWTSEGRSFLLLDVLPGDVHAAWRLPGSANACIYEVAFPDQVKALEADPTAPVIVYGSGPDTVEGLDACARLGTLGFTDVRWFRGGRAAWSDAGLEAEGDVSDRPWAVGETAAPADGEYALDLAKSVVFWHGRNAANGHHGRVSFAEGSVSVIGGKLVGGRVVVDMTTIVCDDLEGDLAQGLLRHLAAGDFFLTDVHPTASFQVTNVASHTDMPPGRPNVSIDGNMTVRGVEQPVRVVATFAAAGEDGVAVQGSLDLDRTRFGSRYGSGRLYDRLGMHLVNDHVSLQVRLVATRIDD